ncbi:NAD(P)-binding protein [Aulographum hederae CBS 113979]|uniref:Short-chain dehydrogenase/reductase 3 n=1 Tax=Aulographum hederae CBS 113979 TaxID=1176131 RepID=A0A6G1H151_9PEZI|nr:NAD(P)-binding protein [Aulographum hederae CBS 113979]
MSNLIRKPIGLTIEPIVTGGLLYALTKAPPQIQDPVLSAIAKLPFDVNVATAVTVLKCLFAFGFTRRVNKWLNSWALNHWQLSSRKKDWDWPKEVAIVTGGSAGIGLIIVKRLLEKDLKVAILDIAPIPAELQNNPNVKYYNCDITSPESIHAAAEGVRSDFGNPSILINNAGIGSLHSVVETDYNFLKKIFDINVISHFSTVKEFMPDMLKANKGHIVTVASMASFVGPSGIADYSATKAGVLAFHETLNQEIRHHHKATGVLATVVHPSWVATALIKEWEADIQRAQGPLMKAEMVGNAIADQVLSCKAAQIMLPPQLHFVSGIRAWPNWVQEAMRDLVGRKHPLNAGSRSYAPIPVLLLVGGFVLANFTLYR